MGNIADFLGDCKCNKNISEIEEMEEIRFSKTKKYTKKEEASRTKSRRDILNQTNETIKEEEAKNAGAEHVGLDDYIAKIKGGWTDVDVIITMPSVMPKVGVLGKILGPRGLMPNPKTGTVTMEVGKAVIEAKAGKIDFKVDKFGIIHASVGKVSFDTEKIIDNARELLQTVVKLKPSSAKGTYMKSVYMSSTMSPSIQIEPKSITL